MKSRLSRRKFLGGAAAVIGLPYLESLEAPARAAVACGARQRFIAGFVPCGIMMPDFTPTTTGKDWTMPYILEPLKSIRSKIAVVTGIDYQRTAHPAAPPGGHAAGTGAFLTMRPVHNNLNDPNRTSLDQRIAADTAACNRPLPSLQLGIKTAPTTAMGRLVNSPSAFRGSRTPLCRISPTQAPPSTESSQVSIPR